MLASLTNFLLRYETGALKVYVKLRGGLGMKETTGRNILQFDFADQIKERLHKESFMDPALRVTLLPMFGMSSKGEEGIKVRGKNNN
jgi:hypothetical protein